MKKFNMRNIILKLTLVFTIIGQAFGNLIILPAYANEMKSRMENIVINEEDYINKMKTVVEPYILSNLKTGTFRREDNINLYYEKYTVENAKANIVISHGFSESLEKYHEVIYYFLQNGYNVFGIEHRGHGRSGTLGVVDYSQVYIENFELYVEDFRCFIEQVVIPNSEDKKLLLYAHSMGGAIGTSFLEKYPGYFEAAVLTAPMHQVNTGSVPNFIAKIVARLAVLFGYGSEYTLGQEPYSRDDSVQELIRNEYYLNIVAKDRELQRGGAAFNWLNEAMKITKEITKKENAKKVKIPVLLFQAGHDTFVSPGGQDKFAKYAPNCTMIKKESSSHSIFMEKDEIIKPYFDEIINFFDTNAM